MTDAPSTTFIQPEPAQGPLTAETFRSSGLLKQVNEMLRPHGWGIAYILGEDGEVAAIQPLVIPVPTETELAALSEEDQARVRRLEGLTVPD